MSFCHNFSTDIVMHSATKFIAGHSDLMAGVLAVKGDRYKLKHPFKFENKYK